MVSDRSNYPTTEDILHVRLQTLGVTEHVFDVNLGGNQMYWMMYDVGGAVSNFCPSLTRTCNTY